MLDRLFIDHHCVIFFFFFACYIFVVGLDHEIILTAKFSHITTSYNHGKLSLPSAVVQQKLWVGLCLVKSENLQTSVDEGV